MIKVWCAQLHSEKKFEYQHGNKATAKSMGRFFALITPARLNISPTRMLKHL